MAATSAPDRAKLDELVAALSSLDELDDDGRDTVATAAEKLAALIEENEQLRQQVRWLAGKPYRPSRDKVPPGQLALDLIDMLTSRDDDSASSGDGGPVFDESNDAPKKREKRKRRGRGLPREVVHNRIDESERCCTNCGTTESEIGFDKQERFIYEPAKVLIVEERCYKYACPRGCGGVAQAAATLVPKPIPGSMASSSMLAHLIASKLLDGMPVERIAKRLRRHGVDLPTSTLNDWVGRAGSMFSLLHALPHTELLACSLVSLDDTPMPARNPAHPKGMQRGRQWIYLGDLDRVAYVEFTEDWKGVHPRRVLEGFSGDVQNDGYAGIAPLFIGEGTPRRIGCNDHARRKFVQALEQRDSRAQPIIDLYGALYRVERDAKAAGADVAQMLARRRATSAPLWQQLGERIAALDATVSNKSPLGKAIIYWNRQQPYLRAFLDDGRLPISNAHVERQIRTVALFRKNSLFYGTVESGKRHAALLSILLTCELVGANPYDYVVDVIDKIAGGWPSARVRELLPHNWLAERERLQQLNSDAVTAV